MPSGLMPQTPVPIGAPGNVDYRPGVRLTIAEFGHTHRWESILTTNRHRLGKAIALN
jgi:hypothetical protein